MKITGTDVDDRISLTASMPELPSASWMSASTIFGRVLSNSAIASAWVRAVPTTRWPRLSTICSMSMAISGSSSMISTSVATWREISVLAWPISAANSPSVASRISAASSSVKPSTATSRKAWRGRGASEDRLAEARCSQADAGVSCGTRMEIDVNSLANSW